VNAIRAGFSGLDLSCLLTVPDSMRDVQAAFAILALENYTRRSVFIQLGVSPDVLKDIDEKRTTPQRMGVRSGVLRFINSTIETLNLGFVETVLLALPADDRVVQEAWRGVEDAMMAGLVMEAGVSNFKSMTILKNMVDNARIRPAFVGVEYSDATGFEDQNIELREWCYEEDIVFLAHWEIWCEPSCVVFEVFDGFRSHTVQCSMENSRNGRGAQSVES